MHFTSSLFRRTFVYWQKCFLFLIGASFRPRLLPRSSVASAGTYQPFKTTQVRAANIAFYFSTFSPFSYLPLPKSKKNRHGHTVHALYYGSQDPVSSLGSIDVFESCLQELQSLNLSVSHYYLLGIHFLLLRTAK